MNEENTKSQKQLVENFLLKTAIPETKLKKECQVNNRMLWDAIKRAHRDVLTGRFWLQQYCLQKDENQENNVVKALYETIEKYNKNNEIITSKMLIEQLLNQFTKTDVEFGAIQKLVNMSLKYIIILNMYCPDFNINIDESQCDCPLDSIILSKLSNKHTSWTKLNKEEYYIIQEEIQAKVKNEKQIEETAFGNILFDFLYW